MLGRLAKRPRNWPTSVRLQLYPSSEPPLARSQWSGLQTAFGAIERAALGLGHRSHRSVSSACLPPGSARAAALNKTLSDKAVEIADLGQDPRAHCFLLTVQSIQPGACRGDFVVSVKSSSAPAAKSASVSQGYRSASLIGPCPLPSLRPGHASSKSSKCSARKSTRSPCFQIVLECHIMDRTRTMMSQHQRGGNHDLEPGAGHTQDSFGFLGSPSLLRSSLRLPSRRHHRAFPACWRRASLQN